MTKNVTLISVAITTLALTTLAGVVYAYKILITPPTPSPTSSAAPQAVAFPLIASSAPANNANISPQDAAAIAVKFSNRTDLYSIELADLNGTQTYKLTFSTGDVLYISLDGQVVGSAPPTKSMVASPTPPPPAIIYTDPIKKKASAGKGGDDHNSNSSGGGGGYEGGDGSGDH